MLLRAVCSYIQSLEASDSTIIKIIPGTISGASPSLSKYTAAEANLGSQVNIKYTVCHTMKITQHRHIPLLPQSLNHCTVTADCGVSVCTAESYLAQDTAGSGNPSASQTRVTD